MIERREREGERERERERDVRDIYIYRERDVRDIEKESERERHRALPYRVCALVENLREISLTENQSVKKG